MWGRKRQSVEAARASEPRPERLRDALRKARVDQAERNAVVVDLHDAEVARLELLDEALDSLFEEIPKEVDLFDRGISRGETPRLWIDSCRTHATAAKCSPNPAASRRSSRR